MANKSDPLKYLKRELGLDQEESSEPAWELVVAAIRDVEVVLSNIEYDLEIPGAGAQPPEMAVSVLKLLERLDSRKHGKEAVAWAIFKLVRANCLKVETLLVPLTPDRSFFVEHLMPLVRQQLPNAKVSELGNPSLPVSGVRPTPLLNSWSHLVQPSVMDNTPPAKGWSFRPVRFRTTASGIRFEESIRSC